MEASAVVFLVVIHRFHTLTFSLQQSSSRTLVCVCVCVCVNRVGEMKRKKVPFPNLKFLFLFQIVKKSDRSADCHMSNCL